MPKPNQESETREEYISRCMSDPSMQEEYPDQAHRLAVCNGIWDHERAVDRVRQVKTHLEATRTRWEYGNDQS